MAEFVIERDIPGAGQMTEEQIRDVSVRSLEVLRGIGPQIQCLHATSPMTASTASTWPRMKHPFANTPAGSAFRPIESRQSGG